MNGAQLHLWLGQAAVMGSAFAVSLSLVAVLSEVGRVRRGALVTMAVIAVLSLPAYATWTPTEDIIRSVPGVTLASVEGQQQVAAFALLVNEALGVIALVGLLAPRRAWQVVSVVRRVKHGRDRAVGRRSADRDGSCFERDVNACSQK